MNFLCSPWDSDRINCHHVGDSSSMVCKIAMWNGSWANNCWSDSNRLVLNNVSTDSMLALNFAQLFVYQLINETLRFFSLSLFHFEYCSTYQLCRYKLTIESSEHILLGMCEKDWIQNKTTRSHTVWKRIMTNHFD